MVKRGPVGAVLAKFCGENGNIQRLFNDGGDSHFNLVTIVVGDTFIGWIYPNIVYEIKYVT